jgi:hypothetical protein
VSRAVADRLRGKRAFITGTGSGQVTGTPGLLAGRTLLVTGGAHAAPTRNEETR